MEFHPSRCHALVDAFRGLAAGHTKKSANNWWVSLVVVATDLNICFKNIIYIYIIMFIYSSIVQHTQEASFVQQGGWVGEKEAPKKATPTHTTL